MCYRRAGWQDWRADERVPKAQLMEAQQAERMGWRDWWEDEMGDEVGGAETDVLSTVTGRERRQVAGWEGAAAGEGGGAWEGQEVVYWGKRDGSNWAGEEAKALLRVWARKVSYWTRNGLALAAVRESKYLPRVRASTSAIML